VISMGVPPNGLFFEWEKWWSHLLESGGSPKLSGQTQTAIRLKPMGIQLFFCANLLGFCVHNSAILYIYILQLIVVYIYMYIYVSYILWHRKVWAIQTSIFLWYIFPGISPSLLPFDAIRRGFSRWRSGSRCHAGRTCQVLKPGWIQGPYPNFLG